MTVDKSLVLLPPGEDQPPLSSNKDRLLLPDEPTSFVLVERMAEAEEQRARLPIYAEEQQIMEMIQSHPVTIICGETGSGKTTQIPQFLYEAGFGDPQGPRPGLIAITQPRRVAAISMAHRVAFELGRPHHVAYQIRYDRSTLTKDTRIKFMTDGILLRELQEDFLLEKYSAILLDEAHERNLNTDILIGMLSRVVRLRREMAWRGEGKPLRLVIMSATLNVDEFQAPYLFSPAPPLIRVEARQYPVTIHMARRTEDDYVVAAFKMIRKIHANLPPGGILVFLTGRQEIRRLASKLKKRQSPIRWAEDEDLVDLDENSDGVLDEEDKEEINYNQSETENEAENMFMSMEASDPLHVLPLYSHLAPEEQQKIFQTPPEGHRLCVLATNVAETSLTIPGIRYVVDSGRVKNRHFDPTTGAHRYAVEWCSQASATQRAGRAGRLGPGHCYRLYSAAVFAHQMPAFATPEIQRCSMEAVALQLKAMGIDRPTHFPLPTLPPEGAMAAALHTLERLRAVAKSSNLDGEGSYRITTLGRRMSLLPLSPRWSRLLIVALEVQPALTSLAMAFASVMSVGDPFTLDHNTDGESGTKSQEEEKPSNPRLKLAGKPNQGDLLMWLNAFLAFCQIKVKAGRIQFCRDYQLMMKRLEEMEQQHQQLRKILLKYYCSQPSRMASINAPLPTRIGQQGESLRNLIAQSLIEQSAERLPKLVRFQGRPIKNPAYRLESEEESPKIVFLHPSSVMYKAPPPAIVYGERLEGESGLPFIKLVTPIESKWLHS